MIWLYFELFHPSNDAVKTELKSTKRYSDYQTIFFALCSYLSFLMKEGKRISKYSELKKGSHHAIYPLIF